MHQLFDELDDLDCTKMYLYLITNILNDKKYIGQTNDLYLRWSQHKSSARRDECPDTVIDRAIKERGEENFVFTPLICCYGYEAANELEVLLVEQYNSHVSCWGYNVEWGGKNHACSEEKKAAISAGLRKHYAEHESIRKGVPLTEAHKLAVSLGSMGKAGTNTGKTFSDEWATKIGKANIGRVGPIKKKFSKEQEAEICQLYESGLSTTKLGNQFDCYTSLIIAVLDRGRIKRRPNENAKKASQSRRLFTDIQEMEICNEYETGKVSIAKLARQFGCGKTTMREILLRHNIKL